MPKIKKSPIFQYGIEITKPFSKDMYSHNDMVAKEMKFNIKDAWHNEAIKFMGDDEWPTESNKYNKIIDIQKSICAVGYGDGYTINEVERDFYSELDNMPNWQLHENYSYMCFKGMIPRTSFMMLGFEWEKCEYGDIDYSGRFASANEMISPIAVMEEQTKNL